jgi:hypothetical protein
MWAEKRNTSDRSLSSQMFMIVHGTSMNFSCQEIRSLKEIKFDERAHS